MNKLKNAMRNKKGFTMIELIMVIIVLGLLAAIAYPTLQDQLQTGYEGQANGVLRAMRTSMEFHYNAGLRTGAVGNAYQMDEIVAEAVFDGIDFDVAPVATTAILCDFTIHGTPYVIDMTTVANLPDTMGVLDPAWM